MKTDHPPFSYLTAVSVPHRGPFSVMDAHCGLCARGAKWIATQDKKQEFGIVPLQSDMGRALMAHYDLDPNDPTTWLMVENGFAYQSAEAIIRTGARIGGVWSVLWLGHLVPKSWLHGAYLVIARNRYRISKAKDWCEAPHPEVAKRLLDRVT